MIKDNTLTITTTIENSNGNKNNDYDYVNKSEVIIFDLLALAPPGPRAARLCSILTPILRDEGIAKVGFGLQRHGPVTYVPAITYIYIYI